jgi:tetratricopeptide (TPR) repeat protein
MAVYPRSGDTDVPAQPSFPALERDVLTHWQAQDTFRASVAQRPEDHEFVFYDGPPFANVLPHYGHLLTGYVKDLGYQDPVVMLNLGCVLRAEGDPDGARSLFEAALRVNRRNGNNWAMAYDIDGLACPAVDAGDWDRAAALRRRCLDRTGVAWDEGEARDRQHSLGQARAPGRSAAGASLHPGQGAQP